MPYELVQHSMTFKLAWFAVSMAAVFLTMIFYIIFGQVTVRKLRKNSSTKNALGMELVSGWDILNVAGALALPRWLNRKLRNTPLAIFYANAELLDNNNNTFDRILAMVFYSLYVFAGVTTILFSILYAFGVFD